MEDALEKLNLLRRRMIALVILFAASRLVLNIVLGFEYLEGVADFVVLLAVVWSVSRAHSHVLEQIVLHVRGLESSARAKPKSDPA